MSRDKIKFNIPENKGLILFSIGLSLSFVMGNKIDYSRLPYFKHLNLMDIVYFIVFFALIYMLSKIVIKALDNRSTTFSHSEENSDFSSYKGITDSKAKSFFIIFLAWMPYFTIYYPGAAMADSYASVAQSLGHIPLLNHHPVLYTLYVGVFVKLGLLMGDINKGIALYTLTQMVIMALIFSYCIYSLKIMGASRLFLRISLMFFALNPVIAINSMSMVKDTLFSGILLLLILNLYSMVENMGENHLSNSKLIEFSLLCLLTVFLRNNGIYIVVIVFFAMVLLHRKHYKKIMPAFTLVIVAVILFQNIIFNVIGVSKGPFYESLGVPLQQMGYTMICDGNASYAEIDYINRLIPVEVLKKDYNPMTSDNIKWNKDFDSKLLEEDKIQFFKYWMSLGIKNPYEYLGAWLMLTEGYYHIGTSAPDRVLVSTFGQGGVNFTGDDGKVIPVTRESIGLVGNDLSSYFFSGGFKKYADMLPTIISNIPLIGLIYNIGFTVWLMWFTFIYVVKRKGPRYILPFMPLIALWITIIIAAPIYCEFRYMYIFHMGMPFLLGMMLYRNENSGGR